MGFWGFMTHKQASPDLTYLGKSSRDLPVLLSIFLGDFLEFNGNMGSVAI
jgi:hypothetical protein